MMARASGWILLLLASLAMLACVVAQEDGGEPADANAAVAHEEVIEEQAEEEEAAAEEEAAQEEEPAQVEEPVEYVEKPMQVRKSRKVSLELRGDLVMEMDQEEVRVLREPGWRITEEGDEPDDVEVFFSQPASMRNGVPGTYKIRYIAQSTEGEELATATRTVVVHDIDECDEENPRHHCHPNAICINTIGSYECDCKAGFRGPGRMCVDVNECEEGLDTCPLKTSHCKNTEGSYECVCNDGYRDVTGDGRTCENIDECAPGMKNDCHLHATCEDLPGTYTCVCNEGWHGDGFECEQNTQCSEDNDCVEHALCVPRDGTYDCICEEPHWEGEDGRVECFNVDECERGIAVCPKHSDCVDEPGSYTCECHSGFEKDGNECKDIDECDPVNPKHDCDPDFGVCVNLVGGYYCDCVAGYTIDKETNKCKDSHKPHLTLLGDNPYTAQQFDEFNEPGFELSDESRNSEDLRASVRTPKQLEGELTKVGKFVMTYTIEFGNEKESVDRVVIVKQTNQCLLPEDHPRTHDCDRLFGECIWHDTEATYTCRCAEGYGGDTGRNCKDNVPPYFDPIDSPFLLTKCQICEEDIGVTPDPGAPLDGAVVRAWDPMPNSNPKAVAVNPPQVTVINATYAEHTYTATDDAGNPAEPLVIGVKVVVKDMRTEIERMNATIIKIDQFLQTYHADFESFKGTQEVQTSRLSAFTYWVTGMFVLIVTVKAVMMAFSKFVLLWQVQNSSKPVWADFEEAWSFYLRLRHPMWTTQQITEEVFRLYAAREQ
eukprot:TRINITY_DN5694_c0_g1_i1.p1 TRINITY_DN5694_c0_g1~~TRINITY_DN5694_c0_g1_i1.p1  ORF type:complete len:773 (+),score=272.60 TRINITY_DN5694_c0_g1_i1:182-2500(+)